MCAVAQKLDENVTKRVTQPFPKSKETYIVYWRSNGLDKKSDARCVNRVV